MDWLLNAFVGRNHHGTWRDPFLRSCHRSQVPFRRVWSWPVSRSRILLEYDINSPTSYLPLHTAYPNFPQLSGTAPTNAASASPRSWPLQPSPAPSAAPSHTALGTWTGRLVSLHGAGSLSSKGSHLASPPCSYTFSSPNAGKPQTDSHPPKKPPRSSACGSKAWKAKQTLTGWRLYAHYAIYFGISTPFKSLSLFTPSITAGLNYKGLQAQLMTVPPYAVAYVVTIYVSWSGNHFNARALHSAIFATIGAAGFLTSVVLPADAYEVRFHCSNPLSLSQHSALSTSPHPAPLRLPHRRRQRRFLLHPAFTRLTLQQSS